MDTRLIDALFCENDGRPPVWLMRQAGRYLPEYRKLREEKGGFLELAYDSDAAAEITLQPIRRFGFDAAILFSDILVIPHMLGQDLWFEAGEGPRLAPPLKGYALGDLKPVPQRLAPIYETVHKVRHGLPETVTLLGFAGSPWTVATYMVAGQGSKDQGDARRMAYGDPARIIRAVKKWESLGVDCINFILNANEVVPRDQVMASLRLFAKEVMPHFARKPGQVAAAAGE